MDFIKCLEFLYILTVLCFRHNQTHNKCWYTVNDYHIETVENSRRLYQLKTFRSESSDNL